MSVSGISSGNSYQYSFQNINAQRNQDFTQLGQALQSGNLASAQSDFAALQQLSNNSGQTSGSQTSGTQTSSTQTDGTATNPISTDFGSLAQALQSGNITTAQTDFTKLEQDLQTSGSEQTSGVHHHHHHHSKSADAGENSGAQAGGTSTSASTNTIGTDFNSLAQALQSGSITNSQSAFAQLQQDIQAAQASYWGGSSTSNTTQTQSSLLNITA